MADLPAFLNGIDSAYRSLKTHWLERVLRREGQQPRDTPPNAAKKLSSDPSVFSPMSSYFIAHLVVLVAIFLSIFIFPNEEMVSVTFLVTFALYMFLKLDGRVP